MRSRGQLPALLLGMLLLHSCGKSSQKKTSALAPDTARLQAPYTKLNAGDLKEIAKRTDEDSINPQLDVPVEFPSTNELVLSDAFWNEHQKHAFADVDLSSHCPAIRDQWNLSICSPVSDIDMVSASFLGNGLGLSAMDVARQHDAEQRYITFDAKQDNLIELSKGGTFLEESSMPLDDHIFTEDSNFFIDYENNFLKKGKFFFKKFSTPSYEFPAEAVSKNENALHTSNPFSILKIDSQALINRAKSKQQISIPAFKISQFFIDFRYTLMEQQKISADWAMESIFKSLYDEQHPVILAVCFNDLKQYVLNYERSDFHRESSDGSCGLHSLLIVGIKTIKKRTYFKIRNSHGLSFGAGGYALIATDNLFNSTVKKASFLQIATVSTKQNEHWLISSRFVYHGEIGRNYMPNGKGEMISFFGGKIHGEFKNGTCDSCANEKFSWPHITIGAVRQSSAPTITVAPDTETKNSWMNLNSFPEVGDIFYSTPMSRGAVITKVKEETFIYAPLATLPPLAAFSPSIENH